MRAKKTFFNSALFPKPEEEPVSGLAVDAFSALMEAEYWINRYNVAARELRYHEYNQFPLIREMSDGHEGMKAEWVFPYLQDGPTPSPFREYLHTDPAPPLSTRKKSLSEIRNELGERCSWICIYCQQPGSPECGPDQRQWHVDHMFPVSKGGDSMDDNLLLSCATCNQKKHANLASEILATIKAKLNADAA